MANDVGSTCELDIERTVAGGAGLAREPEGRVVLVDGALPGERVRVTLTTSKPRMATAELAAVATPAPGRVEPPCPEVHAGCGGCDLQHASPELQRSLKVGIVRDALARIGRLGDVPVSAGEHLSDRGYRTVLRLGVLGGRVAFHRKRSSELHPVTRCLVAHPLLDELLEDGRYLGTDEVTIRVGARTGERLVSLGPATASARVPDDVVVVAGDRPGWVHEVVARRRFRISAGSFFQARPDGAEALVRAVGRALAPFDPSEDRLVDLYGGVGLFTAGLHARRSLLVERSPSAVADAEVNLASLDATIVRANVRRWRPEAADALVADPARAGLGADGVHAVVGTGALRVALVSCDPAALARDARLLSDRGYRATGVELVDLFPHTHHVEAVTAFVRDAS